MWWVNRASVGGIAVLLALAACGRFGFERLEGATGPDSAAFEAGTGTDSLVPGIDVDAPGNPGGAAGGPSGGSGGRGGLPPTGGNTPPDGGNTPPDDGIDSSLPRDASESAPAPNYCLTVPVLAADPVIDGVVDPGLTLRRLEPQGFAGNVTELPPGVSVHYAVAWRSDGVYVFMQIADPNLQPSIVAKAPFCGDSVEIYVDADGVFPNAPGYDKPGTRQFVVMAPTEGTMSRVEGTIYETAANRGSWTSMHYGAFTTANGYNVEAFVRSSDLMLQSWTLGAGQRIGFNLGHNVSVSTPLQGTCSDRYTQYFLRIEGLSAGKSGPYHDTGTFCQPSLQP